MAGLLSQVGQVGKEGHLTISCIVYEPAALRAMRECLQHDQRLRQLPFGTLDRIRKLDLNNKPTEKQTAPT